MQINEFRIGDRIEMHPATDAWMRGDRYGVVREIGSKWLRVRMDRSDRMIRAAPSNVSTIIESLPPQSTTVVYTTA